MKSKAHDKKKTIKITIGVAITLAVVIVVIVLLFNWLSARVSIVVHPTPPPGWEYPSEAHKKEMEESMEEEPDEVLDIFVNQSNNNKIIISRCASNEIEGLENFPETSDITEVEQYLSEHEDEIRNGNIFTLDVSNIEFIEPKPISYDNLVGLNIKYKLFRGWTLNMLILKRKSALFLITILIFNLDDGAAEIDYFAETVKFN